MLIKILGFWGIEFDILSAEGSERINRKGSQ